MAQNRQQRRKTERSEGKHTGRNLSFPRVKVAIPYFRNVGQTACILMHQLATFGLPGYDVHVDARPGCFIHLTRTEMVSRDDFDYIFFFDDDMGFSTDAMHEMVEVEVGKNKFSVPIIIAYMKQILDHKKEICGGVYVNRTAPFAPQVYKKDDGGRYVSILDIPKKGLEEVDAIATGFLCIKQEVFHRMMEDFTEKVQLDKRYKYWLEKKPEEYEALPDQVKDYLKIARSTLYPPFWLDNIWDETKKCFTPVGEDIYFCREAARLGFKIFADYGVRVGHESSMYVTAETYETNYKAEAIRERALDLAEQKKVADQRAIEEKVVARKAKPKFTMKLGEKELSKEKVEETVG